MPHYNVSKNVHVFCPINKKKQYYASEIPKTEPLDDGPKLSWQCAKRRHLKPAGVANSDCRLQVLPSDVRDDVDPRRSRDICRPIGE